MIFNILVPYVRSCPSALLKKHCKTRRFLSFLLSQAPLSKPGSDSRTPSRQGWEPIGLKFYFPYYLHRKHSREKQVMLFKNLSLSLGACIPAGTPGCSRVAAVLETSNCPKERPYRELADADELQEVFLFWGSFKISNLLPRILTSIPNLNLKNTFCIILKTH